MAKDPAFLFYSKDWLEGTAEFMPNEKGVYIDLLAHQHQKGDLPSDIKRLSRLAGLSESEFIEVWSVIKSKFEVQNNRTVNRKLNRLMQERLEKGHKNRIIGIFASLIRTSVLNSKQYKHIKSGFNVDDFIEIPTEHITERLTEWFNERLKSIEDGNGNESNYIKMYNTVKINIEIPESFESLILLWLKYKSEKNQSYKLTGLQTFLKTLLKDFKTAKELGECIDYSMSKNYDGLFKPKTNGHNKQNSGGKYSNSVWENQKD